MMVMRRYLGKVGLEPYSWKERQVGEKRLYISHELTMMPFRLSDFGLIQFGL